MDLVLDENISGTLEQKFHDEGITTGRPPEGTSDRNVLRHAIAHGSPLLTRDANDFTQLHAEHQHTGILIDPHLHLRDPNLVTRTVQMMLGALADDLADQLWWISDFFGRAT